MVSTSPQFLVYVKFEVGDELTDVVGMGSAAR